MAHFANREIGKAALPVAPRRRNEIGKQRRPHVGEFRRNGIGKLQLRLPAAEQFRMRLRNERPGHRLIEAPRRKPAPRRQHALLQGIENRRGNRMLALHGNRRNLVEAMNAANLFDEIGLAIHIRPPGGRRTLKSRRCFLHAEAEIRKNAPLLGKRQIKPAE